MRTVLFPQQLAARPEIRKLVAIPELVPLILLIGEIIVFYLREPKFLSSGNVSNMLAFTPELGMLALGMTMLMTSGEFDLSVGSVFGFAPVVMWTLFNEGKTSLEMGFLAALLIAAFIGLANGWFVTQLRVPSFLVTLGMLLVVRGSALYITSGFPQRTWRAESHLKDYIVGDFYVGDIRIYASLIWFIVFAVILTYVLTQSKVGNWIQAAGGNPSSARARGVRVHRTKMALFVLTAVMSAYAGITSSIRVSAANPNSGTGYELEVIAMVVIGGTLLSGGRGTVIGTVLGVLILRVMRNGIIIVGVPGLAYNIFIGAIILIMMSIHSIVERSLRIGE
jgi:simple sugar transport system permease protein